MLDQGRKRWQDFRKRRNRGEEGQINMRISGKLRGHFITVTPSRCPSPTISPKSRPCFAGSASTAATICQPDFWTRRRDTAQPIGPRPICITRIRYTPSPANTASMGDTPEGWRRCSRSGAQQGPIFLATGHGCIQDGAAQRSVFCMAVSTLIPVLRTMPLTLRCRSCYNSAHRIASYRALWV